MKRRIVAVGAALLVLVGCAASGGPKSPAVPSSRASGPTVETTSTSVSGPWRAWTASVTRPEAHGSCGATTHQVVCATDTGALVGRSRADGRVTWTVPGDAHARTARLLVDAADARAVAGVGGVLRAADLRTGEQAWTRRLPAGRAYVALAATDGIVYALHAPEPYVRTGAVLDAVRASDGTPLWHRNVAWSTGEPLAAFRGRVYTADGVTRVTARDARTGATVASSPAGVECRHLVTGGHYLVCTGSPFSAGDVFPPMRRLDPATLKALPTPRKTIDKPVQGVISDDGILVLYEAGAEDTSAGDWYAYDLVNDRRLWSTYATRTDGAGVAGGRFVTFTPVNDFAARGRVLTIDLHAGPHGTGSAAPRMSPAYAQTRDGEHPQLVVPGGDTGHVVVMARTHGSLRSLPLP
ncbi:PQQ-binding-like beta-propeller repeat protein [Streptomyces sp. 351MFTsu5.1]|uniref:outer membrane protein assembly factor BamB family protein n=1 Tax=Streptomyces sp. 351MFTsu5.1 TaxID=1172180 RepID=UPI000372E717|nr:PQQ-binding-like beta-propeller repeat protein [Streptomyces sp. 351MFTsu5.1]